MRVQQHYRLCRLDCPSQPLLQRNFGLGLEHCPQATFGHIFEYEATVVLVRILKHADQAVTSGESLVHLELASELPALVRFIVAARVWVWRLLHLVAGREELDNGRVAERDGVFLLGSHALTCVDMLGRTSLPYDPLGNFWWEGILETVVAPKSGHC